MTVYRMSRIEEKKLYRLALWLDVHPSELLDSMLRRSFLYLEDQMKMDQGQKNRPVSSRINYRREVAAQLGVLLP